MLLKVAFFAALGGFLYGYDMGLIGGALLEIRAEFKTTVAAEEVIVGAVKIGAFFGTFLGGALMLYYGRRIAIAFDSIFFVIGPVIMAAAYSVAGLVAGRLCIGLGIGISAVVVPAYLGEVAPAQLRGRIVEVYEVLLCAGMLAAVLADVALAGAPGAWRWMVGLPLVPGLALAAALWLLPESPRWLVVVGRLDEALAVIHAVHTRAALPADAQGSTAEVEAELLELWSAVEKEKAVKAEAGAVGARQSSGGPAAPRRAIKPWKRAQSRTSLAWRPLAGTHRGGGTGLKAKGGEVVGACNISGCGGAMAAGLELPEVAEMRAAERGEFDAHTALLTPSLRPEAKPIEAEVEAGLPLPILANCEEKGPGTARLVEGHGAEGSIESGNDSPASQRRALADPTSPLFRSLSSVPNGLPPIRTRSDARRASPLPIASGARAQAGAGSFWVALGEMVGDLGRVWAGPEQGALRLALGLAFFDQAMASTAVVNYAPHILRSAGVDSDAHATLFTSAITAAKIMGVAGSMALVDSAGRRPLMLWGSAACCVALLGVAAGDALRSPPLILAALCAYLAAFSLSYAGLFWVIISELFSMGAKSAAASAATAMLFAAGALANLVFLSLHSWMGAASFMVFAGVAAAGGAFCAAYLPETKGRTLAEVQASLAVPRKPAPLLPADVRTLLHSGALRGASLGALRALPARESQL